LALERRLPGEPGIWVLILGELFVFSLFFVTISITRNADPDGFLLAQSTLNRSLGLANTLLLLTSSLFVALAVQRFGERREGGSALLHAAMGCGCGFVIIKVVEYWEKIVAGVTFTSAEFFTFYFAFTGIHLAHVLLGLGVLVFIEVVARRPLTPKSIGMIECGAIFWHLVDLLWIVLFALFYLAG
jgi:nitric oxide reductase NorE protein